MGLGEDISLEQFLLDFKIDEKSYILGLCYTIQKPTLFLNENQMIYALMYLACMQNPCGEQI